MTELSKKNHQQVYQKALDDVGLIQALKQKVANDSKARFIFILGAGASVESGIPAGEQLVTRWLNDIHQREASDSDRKRSCQDWCDNNDSLMNLASHNQDLYSQLKGFNWRNRAKFYWQIFELRFGSDKSEGYSQLISIMTSKRPSPGYFFLSQLLDIPNFNIVMTTNFDSLVSDSYFELTGRNLLEVGHHSLAGFVSQYSDIPLVIKIHHDVLFAPINDRMVNEMHPDWRLPLERILEVCTPIVVGYGGNDGGLMKFIFESNRLRKGVYWCSRNPEMASSELQTLVAQGNGRFVKINGFDELMSGIYLSFKDNRPLASPKHIEDIMRSRVDSHNEKYLDMIKRMIKNKGWMAKETVDSLLVSYHETDWLYWALKIQCEFDLEKRLDFVERLIERSESGDLTVFPRLYMIKGELLWKLKRNIESAQASFEKGISTGETDAGAIGNYAVFLMEEVKDQLKAEEIYKKALSLNPENVIVLCNYLELLLSERRWSDFYTLNNKVLHLVGSASNDAFILVFFMLVLSIAIRGEDYTSVLITLRSLMSGNSFTIGMDWDFTFLFENIKDLLDDDVAFFKLIAKSIKDGAVSEDLKINEKWSVGLIPVVN